MIERLFPANIKGSISRGELEVALADNLYAGYIRAQSAVVKRLKHHDWVPIPVDLDFRTLNGLSHEMVERLERTRPQTFGEARAIPGLTAAALTTIYVAANLHS
jgi:tRNA uridine 5-carboxymethylaminomethyl modification enzyme